MASETTIFIKVRGEYSLIMFMLDAIVGEIPDEIGAVLSPIIKLAVTGFGIALTIAMSLKYARKRRENPADPLIVRRNMIIMLVLYSCCALFASFDILLGWRYVPYENAYLGIAISAVLTAIGNGFYFWFVLHVLYASIESEMKRRVCLMIYVLIDITATMSSFTLKLAGNNMYLTLIIVHVIASAFIFVLILVRAFTLVHRTQNTEYRKKFKAIGIGTFFGLASIVLFTIDAFSDHVTIYSIIGWLSLLALSYFLSRGYY
nr:hypothetical protein [Candidatus Sigynarchaeota archaeon]